MEALIFYILKSAGILAIFFLSYHLLLKKETFFKTNRHFLLAGVIASLLLPLVIFTKHVYVEAQSMPVWLLSELSSIPETATNYTTIQEPEPFNWLLFLTSIYALGVLFFAVRFGIQLFSLLKLINKHNSLKVNGFNLVETKSNISPFSFFNYIIYNPEKYNQEDLTIILNHEKAHGKQLHSIDILAAQLTIILQWFNPFAWLYKTSIQQNLEFMADQSAILKSECSKQYQHTLLKASLKPQYASITNNFYNSLIKKRIVMLNQSKSNTKNIWKYLLILPALALFLMSFNVKTIEIERQPDYTTSILNNTSEISNQENFTSNTLITEPKTIVKEKPNNNTKTTQLVTDTDPIKIKIDKNTTDTNLKEITKKLKDKGIDFSLKNIKRNSNNEITDIKISYKDDNGNTGNYSLSSDQPINTFYFVKEDDGTIGFASDKILSRNEIIEARELARAESMEWREKHKEEYEKSREQLEARREELEKHKQYIEEHREEIEERVREAREAQREAREELRKAHIISKDQVLYILDGNEINKEDLQFISPEEIAKLNVLKGENALKFYGNKGNHGVIEMFTKKDNNDIEFDFNTDNINFGDKAFWVFEKNQKSVLINKHTSEAELKGIKEELKKQNIDFKYSKVKRNDDGEITRIKISLNDNNGNKSSSTFDTGNETINPILVGKNKNSLIIKSI